MSITETIPFNFDDTYKFIEAKFKEKGYDTQEGSNAMQLVTAMSYLTSMLNANTAINVNETVLPLARKRRSALIDARVLGYEVDHARSFRYNVDLTFSNDTAEEVEKPIRRYSEFTAGGLSYFYLGDERTVTIPPNSSVSTTIEVAQGEVLKYTDPEESALTVIIKSETEADGTESAQSYVDLPYTNVEEDGIEMFLTYFDEFGNFRELEPWTRSETFMIDQDTILNQEFVRIDNVDTGTPRLYFRLGGVGKTIRAGTIVQMNVLRTLGSEGRMTENPSPVDLDAEVTGYSLTLTGSDEETIDSIKDNATMFHNTANRIVTKYDYIAFCNRLAKVQSTQVWDGHDEVPRVPGHIWLSFISNNIQRNIVPLTENNVEYQMQDLTDIDNWYLDTPSGTNIQDIYDDMRRYNIPTLVFHHRNPAYLDFDFDVHIVKYGNSRLKSEVHQRVFEVIDSYFTGKDTEGNKVANEHVESFDYEYFQSNLTKRIDTDLTDITGVNVSMKTSLCLCQMNIIDDEKPSAYDAEGEPTAYYHEFRWHMGYPYEKVINPDTLEINLENLPEIETENYVGTDKIYADFSSPTEMGGYPATVYPVMLGSGSSGNPGTDEVVGEYIVHTGIIRSIEVVLFVQTVDGHSTGFLLSDFDEPRRINVVYPSPNIRMVRNTLPRLKSVKFV